ncbi:hypothetical protein YC2023_011029 [Brassica napus]
MREPRPHQSKWCPPLRKKGDFVNPLQVLAQLSCLLVLFSGSRAAYAGASTG